MNSEELKKRFKKFALRIIKLAESLPDSLTGKVIAKQLIRSGTSPGANYRAACIAKSKRDFINKLKIVEEELDETLYWLELVMEANLIRETLLQKLVIENEELLKIIISSINTAKKTINSK